LEIKEYDSSRISKPNVIVGVPEAGLVGTIAASYLAEQMKLPEAGYIESDLIPPVVVIHESKPHNPIRILGLNNIAIIMSEVPLPPKLAVELGSEVVRWAKMKNSELLIGITSVPFEGRIEHAEEGKTPHVLALASDSRLSDLVKRNGTDSFEEGMLIGTYAVLVKQSMLLGQPNLTLLAEAYPQFPDPGAAAAVIEVLNKTLHLGVDVTDLVKQSEEIRIRMRQLMARTRENMKKMEETTPSLYT